MTATGTRLLRPKHVYGRGGKLDIGRTKFHEDYVHHAGGPANVPGTDIPRLHPIPLGPRSIAFAEDEIDAFIEALRAHRNAHPTRRARPARR